jgi:hypothetical protein
MYMEADGEQMADPTILAELLAFVVKNAPAWLTSLRSTLIEKGEEMLFAKGKRLGHRIFQLDDKEQLRHLEQALRNATERGFASYQAPHERELYHDVVQTLSQQGAPGDALRCEAMRLFTLAEEPDLAALSDIYNSSRSPSRHHLDATAYLNSFFSALLGELYADSYFRPQLSDALQLRAFTHMEISLRQIVSVLQQIGEKLDEQYTAEDLAHDIDIYTAHVERTLHHLKIVGIVPKDKNVDPELGCIFVPLRIAVTSSEPDAPIAFPPDVQRRVPAITREESIDADMRQTPLVSLLERSRILVLLGGPGSGKSTATKHLAWSHVVASRLSCASAPMPLSLLSGHPLPLRIELRVLSEMRKRANYDFLSFVSDVLLKREGVEIHPQMFKELLARRGIVLIFDGLDEVSTLEERLGLVNEIEHFALRYPGNRIIVTSRPAGYDLARFSHPLFFHAEIQPFDDTQIQQFLENWYTAVLGLSPLPQREREEMNLLLAALKENARLHMLAENPLLLTVITQLHRYERLPDRRVQVYDRCADLLLETWAKLRGTLTRWHDMKMVKEEQYACVAFLGLTLHQRSQETEGAEDQAVDVPARFLRKKVEEFLRQRKQITEGAERQAEARRFVEMIQEEAGLIVERGTDENGDALYSFVHRTFQEYFAAADIYERYQQEEDPKVISTFLSEHLHDPHWREVIMLLLGKLKSTPVTRQLRQILQGEIQSQRSCYTEIVQQDLFFVCTCLVEEIKVEKALVEMVMSSLKKVIQSTWSRAQGEEALNFLGALMQTRQYRDQAKEALCFLATKQGIFDEMGRLAIIEALYLHSSLLSEERQMARALLTDIVQRPDLSAEQIRETVLALSRSSPAGSQAQQLATTLLSELVQRPDLSVEQIRETAVVLYDRSPAGSQAQQLATTLLSELVQRPDLSVEQKWKIARALSYGSPTGSQAQHLATTLLNELVQRPDLSAEQIRETAVVLYERSLAGSQAQQLGTALLSELVQRPDLSAEQIRETAVILYNRSPTGSQAQHLATTLLNELVQRPDLSVEQRWKTAEALSRSRPTGLQVEHLATTLLSELVQRPDLSAEQIRETAVVLYDRSRAGSQAQQLATTLLSELAQRPDLSVEQRWKTAVVLYYSRPTGSQVEHLATTLLSELVQRPDLSVEQIQETAVVLYYSPGGLQAQQLATTLLSELVQRPDLSVEQMRETAVVLYYSPGGLQAQQLATTLLSELVQRPDLSVEQMRETAVVLYGSSPAGSQAQFLATRLLLRQLSQSCSANGKSDVYPILRNMVPQFHKLQ